jgi:exopolysaccharide production protein ExoY
VESVENACISLEFPPVRDRALIWKAVGFAERCTAALILLLVFPLLIFAAIVVVVISRRSPLVAHRRVGQGGRLLWVLKLRTMWKGDSSGRALWVHRLSASEAPVLPPNVKNARVTSRFAAFCRRYSLDELPQLWHVVRGEMSLVGPRPLTREELDTYYGTDAARVLFAKPGLTGLWQIRGRSRLTYAQRRRFDLFLIRKWSVPLYLQILLVSLPRVLAGKDAW